MCGKEISQSTYSLNKTLQVIKIMQKKLLLESSNKETVTSYNLYTLLACAAVIIFLKLCTVLKQYFNFLDCKKSINEDFQGDNETYDRSSTSPTVQMNPTCRRNFNINTNESSVQPAIVEVDEVSRDLGVEEEPAYSSLFFN
jgi:hypothetical protein